MEEIECSHFMNYNLYNYEIHIFNICDIFFVEL